MTSARHNNNMLMDGQIKLREKVGYGLGDAASSMFWKLFGSYLLFFYTDIFGLPAGAVGTMFLITRFWDSFVDPVVGIIADRTQSRRGKFRPYLLWFAVPFGVAGVLTFTTPGFGMTGKLVYAYITYGLMMMISRSSMSPTHRCLASSPTIPVPARNSLPTACSSRSAAASWRC